MRQKSDVDEKEDDNEEEEGGGGDADVGEPGLEGADEVRNVEAPEEGGEATSLCEALEELGEGVGYPRRRPKGCGMQSPSGPKVYPLAGRALCPLAHLG